MNRIARTGFVVSLLSFGLFAMADYARPGFVSYVFSVYWFLFAALVFGVWWALLEYESETSKLFAWPVKIAIGVTLLALFWKEGGAFGDFRALFALVGLILPWVVPMVLRGSAD